MDGANLLGGASISFIAAVVPTLLYVLLVRWVDLHEQEPGWLLLAALIWGAVPAVVVSLILELALGYPLNAVLSGVAFEVAQASGIAPIVEESAKALGLIGLMLLFRAEFDGVLDGIVYGALIGFGFGMTENFFYFLGAFQEGGYPGLLQLAFLRAVVFGFTHAIFTGIFGAALGYARGGTSKLKGWGVPILGLGAAMAFHALHNFGAAMSAQTTGGVLLSLVNIIGGFLLILIIIVWSLSQERRWIAEELKDEVNVSITSGEYSMLTRKRSILARKTGPLACLSGRHVRLLVELERVATDLAFKKRRVRQGEVTPANLDAIADLRARIGRLRQAAAGIAQAG